MIGATNDVADAHVHIIGDHAQVIRGPAIGAQQHKVFQLSIRKFHASEDGVVERGAARFGHGEANGCGFSCGATLGAFLARNLPAGAFVTGRAAFSSGRRATRFQLRFGAETIVGMSGGQQLSGAFAIELHALSLMVWALVPVETKPAHALQNAFDHLGCRALEISVFNAQDERASVMTGEQPVEQRRTGATYVQIAGR